MMTITFKQAMTTAVLALLVLSLSGCFAAGRATQALFAMGKDRCDSSYPILPEIEGCPARPNYGITRENANDVVRGECALSLAVGRGTYDMFERLLAAGADPHQCIFPGKSSFFMSWVTGVNCWNERFPKRLLQLGIKPTLTPEEFMMEGLIKPCDTVVEFAVQQGADPNSLMSANRLPLQIAVSDGTRPGIATVRMLVKMGADPNRIVPGEYITVYEYAKSKWTDPRKGRLTEIVWPAMEKALLQQ